MRSLFSSNTAPASNTPAITPGSSLRIQSSAQGAPVNLLLGGQARIAGNLIWYDDFTAVAHQQDSGGGGGGGKGGGGGQAQPPPSISYTYTASFVMAICQGLLDDILQVWNNKSVSTPAALGMAAFDGSSTQAAWGYLTTAHPDKALTYRYIAYVGSAGFDLGTSQEIPQLSFECLHSNNTAIAGLPDASAPSCMESFLVSPFVGVGFPSARLGDLTLWTDYTLALSLVVSPLLSNQTAAQQFAVDLCDATNTDARWSNGVLDFIPRGDKKITGNGHTYDPDTTPQYDFDYDSYIAGVDAGQAGGPLDISRKSITDIPNVISIRVLDRSNDYNPKVIQDRDEASIIAFGRERPANLKDYSFFCNATSGRMCVALLKARAQMGLRQYVWNAGKRFILLDVGDIVTVSDPGQNVFRAIVRITEIQENTDRTLTFTAEDFPGTASAPHYGQQASSGNIPNYNSDPGPVNDPIIFEPTDQLAGGLQVWSAVSGQTPAKWGGCYVLASYDGTTFQNVGTIRGNARMGDLTADLAPIDPGVLQPILDDTHTLSVDLTESAASLLGGTHQDAVNLATACYVDGEIIAYQDATLTATNKYDLTGLVRGAYGTEAEIVTHPAGSKFARLDQGIFQLPYDQGRIGQTIYLKFQSFNIWGGGLEDVSSLPVYQYVITGSALTSPLPNVQNVRTVFTDGFTEIYWDDIIDFRNGVRYRIYRGPSFAGAEIVGDQAHAPFKVFGEGKYWIVPYCQPVAALYVFADTPGSITISGSMLVANLVFSSDQRAAGWPGIFSNGVAKIGVDPNAFIGLGGSGNILTDADILNTPDVLNYGGIVASGTYEVSAADYVDVGYLANCYVNASWLGVGQPVGQDILSIPDILDAPDVLGSASTQYVNVRLQIATADIVTGDIYAAPDVFDTSSVPDAYTYGIPWTDWRDYAPGVYLARIVKFRILLETTDPNTVAINQVFSFVVSVPPRIDHYQDVTVGTGGVTIVFEPDNASTAAPFNGGPPLGGADHSQPLPFVNISWSGHPEVNWVQDSLALSGLTGHFEDSLGNRVAVDGVNIAVEGF